MPAIRNKTYVEPTDAQLKVMCLGYGRLFKLLVPARTRGFNYICPRSFRGGDMKDGSVCQGCWTPSVSVFLQHLRQHKSYRTCESERSFSHGYYALVAADSDRVINSVAKGSEMQDEVVEDSHGQIFHIVHTSFCVKCGEHTKIEKKCSLCPAAYCEKCGGVAFPEAQITHCKSCSICSRMTYLKPASVHKRTVAMQTPKPKWKAATSSMASVQTSAGMGTVQREAPGVSQQSNRETSPEPTIPCAEPDGPPTPPSVCPQVDLLTPPSILEVRRPSTSGSSDEEGDDACLPLASWSRKRKRVPFSVVGTNALYCLADIAEREYELQLAQSEVEALKNQIKELEKKN